MGQIISRGTSVLGTSGTTWATTANAIDGTPPAIGGTWAQWTNAASGGVGYIEITGYHTAFAAIPSDAVITGVSLKPQHHVSAATRYASITFQPYDGSTAIGTAAVGSIYGSSHSDLATFSVTRAQLQASTFKCRITWTRGANTTSAIASLDSLDVVVNYAQPGEIAYYQTADWGTIGTSAPGGYYKDIALTGLNAGDMVVAFGTSSTYFSGDSTRSITTTAGSTSAWTTNLPAAVAAADSDFIAGWATVTSGTTATIRVQLRSGGSANMGAAAWVIPAANWSGIPAFTTIGPNNADAQISATITATSTVLFAVGDWNAIALGASSTPAGASTGTNTQQSNYSITSRLWSDQTAGTRAYGTVGTTGADAIGTVISIPVGVPTAVPTLVSTGRGASATTVSIDVTGGRTLFLVRNNSATSLSSNNGGVTLLGFDSGGPRRNSVWNIAPGTTGTVIITANAAAVWGYCIVDWPVQSTQLTMGYTGGNTTAAMATVNIPSVTPAAQVAVFWNGNTACDWDASTTGFTNLETITTQNAEPSWTLRVLNAPVSGSYTTPVIGRGKEGTTIIELCAVAALVAPTTTGRPKAYVAGSFQKKPGKWWNGTTWIEKPWKQWTGSIWKTLT